MSKKPSKQRERLFQAPYHRRGNILSAHLSSELKSSYNTRALPLRKGDTVKVLRGDHRGFEGKIAKVDRKKYRIFIEGINREKSDGTTIPVPIHPSKVEIVRLNLDDKWRKEILERKGAVEKPEKLIEKTETTSERTSEEISAEIGGT
ncbi:MAG: 50S ribosomal protein L24 [Candidatus Bathyarchaeia archaeon]